MSHNYGIMSPKTLKTVSRYIMSLFYVSVGINHFLNPEWFVKIIPPILLEFDYQLVYLSGVCEVMFGLLILIPKARYYAAWGLILTLAAVFPANIYLAQSKEAQEAIGATQEIATWRLPIQGVLIWIAYYIRR